MTNRNSPRKQQLYHMGNARYNWEYLSWGKEDLEETKRCHKPAIWKNLGR